MCKSYENFRFAVKETLVKYLQRVETSHSIAFALTLSPLSVFNSFILVEREGLTTDLLLCAANYHRKLYYEILIKQINFPVWRLCK